MHCACRDGCAKIFQQPLDAKKAEKNRARGIDIASALTQQRGTEVGSLCSPEYILYACSVMSGNSGACLYYFW